MIRTSVAPFRVGEILTAERLNQLVEISRIGMSASGAAKPAFIGRNWHTRLPIHHRDYYELTGQMEVIERQLVGDTGTQFDEYPSCTCKHLVYSSHTNRTVAADVPIDERVWFPFLPTWAIWPSVSAYGSTKVVAWADAGTGRLMCDMELPEKLLGKPLAEVASGDTGDLRVHYFDTGANDWIPIIDPTTSAEVDINARNPWNTTIAADDIATIIRLGTGEYIYDGANC